MKIDSSPNAKYKLVIAANRDEYYNRPTKPASIQPDGVLCGLDMQINVEGGTWLGVNKSGKFAFLTNILVEDSDPGVKLPRGMIVKDYLQSSIDPLDYIETKLLGKDYRLFNFVGGYIHGDNVVATYHGKSENYSSKNLHDGVYVFACTNLETIWKKKTHGKKIFTDLLKSDKSLSIMMNELFENLLTDTTCLYPDDEIKKQSGLNFTEDELKKYCSVCISGPLMYGTRTQTVVVVDDENVVHFKERNRQDSNSEWIANSFNFQIQPV